MDVKNRKNKKSRETVSANSENAFSNELNAPVWSVVSFDERVAGNLTYAEAAAKLKNLAAERVSGLCVITDEAAARIKH